MSATPRPRNWLTPDAFLEVLEGVVRKHGTQVKAAKALGISSAYLCDVRKRRREPAQKLLTALGYRRVVIYEQVG